METNGNEASTWPVLAMTVMELITAGWMSQAVYAAAELRLPDLIAAGIDTPDGLARATATHRDSLSRLVRALTALELCAQTDDGSYTLTRRGALLRSTGECSLHAFSIWWGRHLWPI